MNTPRTNLHKNVNENLAFDPRSFFNVTVLSFATLSLAACGGGSTGASPSSTVPQTKSTQHALATMTLQLPRNDSSAIKTQSNQRLFISPGTNNLTFILDGTKITNGARTDGNAIPAYNGADGTRVTFSETLSPDQHFFVFTISLDVVPGAHTIGVDITGGAPAVILSEGQHTFNLAPGPNPPGTLTLSGVLGSAYIECANGPVDSTNCASSFDGTKYTLTAIGADFDGFPIINQSLSFDNGGYTVIENDANGIVALTNNGPFLSPGNALTGPSGGFYVFGSYVYGNQFNAKCNKVGSASLALTNSQKGPINPLAGEAYSYFDPSAYTASSNYPSSGLLPVGSKTGSNPDYHNGSVQNAVTNLMKVNCDASLVLTVN